MNRSHTTTVEIIRASSPRWRSVAFALAATLCCLPAAHAAIYTYENTNVASNTIPQTVACTTSGLQRDFVVTDSFTVQTIALGLTATHGDREQIRAILRAPDLTTFQFLAGFDDGNNTEDNYDILLSSYAQGSVDDGSDDPSSVEPYDNRLAQVVGANFYTGNSSGTWSLFLCDIDPEAPNNGTFNRARLVLSNSLTGTAGETCSEKVTYEWCLAGGGCNGTAFPGAVVVPLSGNVTLNLASTNDFGNDDLGGYDTYTPSFARQSEQLGAHTGFYLEGAMNISAGLAPAGAESAGMVSTWNFTLNANPVQVNGLVWTALDVDFSNGGNSFQDLMRTIGYTGASAGGTAVPFVQTLQASNAAAGDIVLGISEVVHGSPGSSGANPSRRFLRGVASVAFGYTASDFVTPEIQYVGIADPSFCVFDFGDAPDSYGTISNTTAARHVMGQRNLYLGANPPDGETTGKASADASDDNDHAGNLLGDEDGVASFLNFVGGSTTYTVSVSATNTTGSAASLVGYIDWNGNGNFNQANERSATVSVPNNSLVGPDAPQATNFDVTWNNVPANASGTTSRFARFRIALVAAEAESPTGLAGAGEVEDYLIPAGTLPVTLASFESLSQGHDLTVRWSTASESGNAGFRLWGYNARGERNLLSTVKSQGPDSFGVQRYEAVVPGKGLARIEIEDVSVFGGESRFHGPYAIGSAYGVEPADASVDWSAIRSESGVVGDVELMAAAERGESSVRSMIAMSREKQGRLLVREEGIHRVTYEQLRSAGVDFAGIKHGQIAVTNHGVAVPRHIQAMGSNFGPGASIEFVARPVLTLASPVDVYVVQVNPSKVKVAGAMAVASGVTRTIDATDLHESELTYSYAAPNGDPWYEQGLLAWGGSASLSRSFDLPDLATGPVAIDLRTWGIGDWPGSSPEDHHVVVRLNGSEIADRRFDGPIALDLTLDVTGLVTESGNTLEVVAPGDTGFELDYIAYDSFTVRYRRSSEAIDGKFVAKGVPGGNVAIGGFDPGALVSVWRLAGVNGQRGLQTPVGGQVFSTGNGDLFAAAGAAIRTPAIVAGIPAAKTSSNADYVIVTHPVFADALGDLVALEGAKGLSTEVVTVDRIYAAYSDHAASPAAIRSFFSASLAKGMQYALIVGADSSDPYDHLNLGSVSYVPTDYLPLNPYVQFSPTDESLVDAGGDGLGDAPIGRFPARTVAELEAMVAKLYAWESQVATGRTALLAAGISDTEAAHMDAINDSYAATLTDWSPQTAAVDELGSAAARVAVLEALNGGAKLVSYVGHSSMGQWDWTPLLQWQDAASLTNNGAPNLVTAWGCWNSYYVEPTIESLSARLLRQPNAGAAGAIGATTLTSEASHQALGNLFFQQVNAGATRVGDAFHAAKQALAAEGGQQDAIMGMTLLGDPAMSLPPAD